MHGLKYFQPITILCLCCVELHQKRRKKPTMHGLNCFQPINILCLCCVKLSEKRREKTHHAWIHCKCTLHEVQLEYITLNKLLRSLCDIGKHQKLISFRSPSLSMETRQESYKAKSKIPVNGNKARKLQSKVKDLTLKFSKFQQELWIDYSKWDRTIIDANGNIGKKIEEVSQGSDFEVCKDLARILTGSSLCEQKINADNLTKFSLLLTNFINLKLLSTLFQS